MKSAPNFYAESDHDDASFAGDTKDVQLVAANPPIRMDEKSQLFTRIPHYVRMLERSNRSRDFEDINFIGGGAFSNVYSAVHRLDGRRYALKKLINISSRTALRHAREEVAVLSRLEHPNVVRYYTCWIETGFLPPSSSDPVVSTSSQARVSLAEEESEASSPLSTDCPQGGRLWRVARSSGTSGGSHSSCSFNSTSNSSGAAAYNFQVSDEEEEEEGDMQLAVPCPASRLHLPKPSLFIQMELCHSTLEDWLRQRNSRLLCSTNELPPAASATDTDLTETEALLRRAPWSRLRHAPVRWLFDQIVNGLQYLHQNCVLHRDLKPANVFLMGPPLSCISERPCLVKHCAQLSLAMSNVIYSTNHLFCYHLLRPKIGDFGLSTILPRTGSTADFRPPCCTAMKALPAPVEAEDQQPHEPSNQLVRNSAFLTGNLGTLLYAAPEVIDAGHNRNYYGFKADIYSLGVILFQMLYPCATESELVSHLVRFQQGEKVAIASASAKGKGTKRRRNGNPKKHLLPRELTLLWPGESRLLSRMLSCRPVMRPDATELLEKLCLTSEVPELARYRTTGSFCLHQDGRSHSTGSILAEASLVDQLILRNRTLEQQVASLTRKLKQTFADKSVP